MHDRPTAPRHHWPGECEPAHNQMTLAVTFFCFCAFFSPEGHGNTELSVTVGALLARRRRKLFFVGDDAGITKDFASSCRHIRHAGKSARGGDNISVALTMNLAVTSLPQGTSDHVPPHLLTGGDTHDERPVGTHYPFLLHQRRFLPVIVGHAVHTSQGQITHIPEGLVLHLQHPR